MSLKRRQLITGLTTVLLLCAGSPVFAQTGSALSGLNRQQRPVPLPLDEAFPFYVSETTPGQWQITWNPAPGHYLYRHAFKVSLQQGDDNAVPVAIDLPEGLPKSDQFFGDIVAYYGTVTAALALPTDLATDDSQLWIEYQGCADWGFCYPPQRRAFPLQP